MYRTQFDEMHTNMKLNLRGILAAFPRWIAMRGRRQLVYPILLKYINKPEYFRQKQLKNISRTKKSLASFQSVPIVTYWELD